MEILRVHVPQQNTNIVSPTVVELYGYWFSLQVVAIYAHLRAIV